MKIEWEAKDFRHGTRLNTENPMHDEYIMSGLHQQPRPYIVVNLRTGTSEAFETTTELAKYLNDRGFRPYVFVAGERELV